MLLDTFIQTHKTLKPMKKRYEFADFIPSRESVKDSKANVRVTKYNIKSHFDSIVEVPSSSLPRCTMYDFHDSTDTLKF